MIKWIMSSFKRQIIFTLFTFILIVGLASITKHFSDEKQRLEAILESQVSQMSHRFSLSISEKIFYNKFFELSDDILNLYDYTNKSASDFGSLFKIKNIAVVDKQGKMAGNSNPIKFPIGMMYKEKLINKQASQSELIWNKEHTLLHLKTPVYLSNELVGHVFMNIDPIYLERSEDVLIYDILLLSTVFTLLLFIFAFFFAKWIDKPLFEVIKQLSNIGEGKIDFPFALTRKDEFHILAKSIKDVDKRIYLQKQELLSIQKGLEDAVEERTIELKKKADRLTETLDNLKKAQKQLIETEKMSALGGLVAGVAHEINTPVGVSLTGITHIERDTKIVLSAMRENKLGKNALNEYLMMVEAMSNSMHLSLRTAAHLISSFKQVAVDQHSEDRRSIDLKEYVDEILLSLSSGLKHTKITIENRVDENLLIYSYPGIYSQILTNLIMNSVIHAFDEEEEGKIICYGYVKGKRLFFTYEDNGKGMEEEVRKKMFNPFFTTQMGKGGSGLGLSIIYNLVHHKLKGDIECVSTLGKGMKVIITVPTQEFNYE